MEKKEFKISIHASKQKIWDVLWNDETYPTWTAPFAEDSYAETDWKEGSKVLFLGPNKNGMVGRIHKKDAPQYMSFEYLGVVVNGEEDTTSKKVQSWKGGQENYTLITEGNKTKLHIEADIAEKYLETFENAWPKALKIVKELSENKS